MNLRRHMTSIVFIVAAISVSVYAYVVDRDKIGDQERNARGAALFPAFRQSEVSRIEIVHGDETMVLSRRLAESGADAGDAEWKMEFPVSANPDAAAVQTLLDALDHGNVIRRVDDGTASPERGRNVGKDGLASPRARGTITMGKVIYSFIVGGEAPKPEGAGYLELEGEGTFVVGRDLVTELLKGAEAYRERTIVPYLSIALSRLRVGAWTIERTDDISFRFIDDPKVRVSREAIDRVWGALGETRADSFLDPKSAAAALGESPVVVVMTPKDGAAPGELAIGGVCPAHPEDVVVSRRAPTPLAACAPKVILEGLLTPREKLVDARIFAAHFDEAEELRLQALPSGAIVEIVRKGSGWHARAPEDRELAKDEVEMANALVTSIVKGEGQPLSAEEAAKVAFTPSARATVVRAETGFKEDVELGAAGGKTAAFWVRRAADGVLLAIDRDLARKLEPRAIALRGSDLWPLPLDGKEVGAVSTRCAGVDQELTREGTTFAMRRPAGYPGDNGAAIDVFEALARAKASSWVADADDGSFGFADGCRIGVGVRSDGGLLAAGLLLGREGEGGVYAKVEGNPAVLVVPKSLKEMAGRPLVDRNAFFIEPASVSTLILRRGATTKTFSKGEGDIFASLGRLRAEEVSHLGAAKADEGFAAPSLEIQATTQNDAGAKTVRITLGRATLLRDQKVYFARIAGVDATFVIVKERLAPLLDAVD